jgi:hypothetical protein
LKQRTRPSDISLTFCVVRCGPGLLTNNDRCFFVQLYRWFPSILQVLTVVRPEALVHWHRAGFRCYWRWKSRSVGGRPPIETDLCVLIRRMSIENPLWGAPRIHGELLKLGFQVAQSTVAKYMARSGRGRSQTWKTFLCNHAPDISAMDMCVVPTVGFKLLYAIVIMQLDRRRLVWTNATTNPTAEWIARQITEAFPWDQVPRYLLRDRDRVLRGNRPTPIAGHGDPRPPDCATLALAEWPGRTAHRIDPVRVPRPSCGHG